MRARKPRSRKHNKCVLAKTGPGFTANSRGTTQEILRRTSSPFARDEGCLNLCYYLALSDPSKFISKTEHASCPLLPDATMLLIRKAARPFQRRSLSLSLSFSRSGSSNGSKGRKRSFPKRSRLLPRKQYSSGQATLVNARRRWWNLNCRRMRKKKTTVK